MNALDFFLTIREVDVWCSEHDEPVDTWTPGPAFASLADAESFIAISREWYEGPTAPARCVFRHPSDTVSGP